MTTSINQALRLITLWIAWLLAMLFHVDLGAWCQLRRRVASIT
jgi:hypothetical protein